MNLPIVAPDSLFPDFGSDAWESSSEIRVHDGEISVKYMGALGISWRGPLYYFFRYKPALGCFIGFPVFWSALWLIVNIVMGSLSSETLLFVIIFLVVFISQSVAQVIATLFGYAWEFPIWNKNKMATFSITPEGFCEKVPGKTIKVKWSHIKCMRFDAGDVHFIRGIYRNGRFVPRESFMNLEDSETFYAIAHKLWESNGEAWYEVIDQYQTGTFNKSQ